MAGAKAARVDEEARLGLGVERAPSSVEGLRTLTTLPGRTSRHEEASIHVDVAVDPNDPDLRAIQQDTCELNASRCAEPASCATLFTRERAFGVHCDVWTRPSCRWLPHPTRTRPFAVAS